MLLCYHHHPHRIAQALPSNALWSRTNLPNPTAFQLCINLLYRQQRFIASLSTCFTFSAIYDRNTSRSSLSLDFHMWNGMSDCRDLFISSPLSFPPGISCEATNHFSDQPAQHLSAKLAFYNHSHMSVKKG